MSWKVVGWITKDYELEKSMKSGINGFLVQYFYNLIGGWDRLGRESMFLDYENVGTKIKTGLGPWVRAHGPTELHYSQQSSVIV